MDLTNIFVLLLSDNVFCSAPGTAKKIIDKNVEIVPPKQKPKFGGLFFLDVVLLGFVLAPTETFSSGFRFCLSPGETKRCYFPFCLRSEERGVTFPPTLCTSSGTLPVHNPPCIAVAEPQSWQESIGFYLLVFFCVFQTIRKILSGGVPPTIA